MIELLPKSSRREISVAAKPVDSDKLVTYQDLLWWWLEGLDNLEHLYTQRN